jgi:aspartyl-tRNA(Asn)/glutamyl-tRNA(Gln) amidotransferase subunit C
VHNRTKTGRFAPQNARFAFGCHPARPRGRRRFHPSTMSLTLQDIGRIANLARLDPSPAQRERLLVQLNGFFDIVEQMNAVDTTGVEPLAHPTAVMQDVRLRLRPDVVSEPDQREANQQSAPAVERGLFLVPKVIE